MPVAARRQGSAAAGGSPGRGFSVTEVLLLVLVLALLLGLVLPPLSAVRKRVAVSSCTGNLRRLGQAYRMYSADYGAAPDPLQWTRAVPDRRVLFCPADSGEQRALSSYTFRTRIPPGLSPYWQLPHLEPATVLAICGHHLDQPNRRREDAAAMPRWPFKLVLRANGSVSRIPVQQIREVAGTGPRPEFWRLYPGEEGYDQAR